ncbi:testis-expressed protein 44 [Cervus elaphus]|uniref:testis-expressed protein 44 n=1 Tax=Cervus canadensis TaxID=1574408 RepID=UPI001CA339D0|nr:testis-expressed protein 44 [Cervus canadensis]XP_043764813.1 testis-expressed protein 44 [Cervus elaphus]
MTTVPLGEAGATNNPLHGDSRSTDIPAVGSQSEVPLLADDPASLNAITSAERQDVDHASIEPATSGATSESGDADKHEVAEGDAQEPREATALPADPAPDILKNSLDFQNLVQKVLVQDSSGTQNPQIFQVISLVKEATPQAVATPDREQEPATATPSAEVQSPQNVEAQPVVSTANPKDQLDPGTADTPEAVEEKPEGPEALNPDPDSSPSAPASPGPGAPAPQMGPLDSTAGEENSYMRSMTSLLGGGEGSISSLADILVWSDATMGLATGFLATGRGSMSDLLHSPGPSLRSVSSILGRASSALSSRLVVRTRSALRSVTHVLESVEQRTVEGIRSAMRYLTSHLTPH